MNFFDAVQEYERKLIGEALTQVKGNQAKAARILGLKPTTLNSQLRRLGINPKAYRCSFTGRLAQTFKDLAVPNRN